MIKKCDVPYMLALTEKLHRQKIITSCLTCDHFYEPEEMCNLCDRRPPAKVIAYGCLSWRDLPF